MGIKNKLRRSYLGNLLANLRQVYRRLTFNYRKEMGHCAETAAVIDPISFKNPKNVFMYDDTGIKRAIVMTPEARFIMKKHSGAAEGLVVLTGNHDRILGRFYRSIKQEEKVSKDKDVVIEEDCWMGVNVTLLPGVTLRRGTTVAAGAVVCRDSAPYSVIAGVPAKHVKFYWTIEQILEHESILYTTEERYTREQLEAYFKQYTI